MLFNNKNQATIIVTPSERAAESYIEKGLKNLWCKTKESPCGCSCCRMIKNRTYFHQMWISPEKGYKIEDIKPVLHISKYSRSENESFVFILDKAETFTPAVANRLLILLEEPPTGYYFILITKNISAIIPTIISRCFIEVLSKQHDLEHLSKLCQAFTGINLPPMQQLYTILKEEKPDHRVSKQYLDIIRSIHIKESFKHYDHKTSRNKKNRIINLLNLFSQQLPRQGGSDLFWKLLYFSWPS
ncbi:hypothetical protein JKY79_01340 [Candidatus Babeliales bacterium]|nr:hypothetical protein [Candidatus Babeliales bacterium]